MIRTIMAWGPATIWAAFLFFLSSRTWSDGPSLVPLNDKVVHVALYAVLGATLALARRRSPATPPHAAMMAAGLLYALSDEYHQSFVPGRTPDAADFAADAVGVFAGYAAGLRLLGTGRPHAADRDDASDEDRRI